MTDQFKPCIDLGHGGPNQGAVFNGLTEKDLNLEAGKRLDASFAGTIIVPVTTRQGDYDPSWSARRKIAVDSGCNFGVSIHFNANRNHTVGRAEGYHRPGDWLGEKVCREFVSAAPIELRSGKVIIAYDDPARSDDDWLQRPETVLDAFAPIPWVLFECGYLTNKHDADFIKSQWGMDAIVSAARCAIIRAAILMEDT